MSPATGFLNSRPLSSSQKHRAYADVVLIDPTSGARSPTISCLVDTGSDYTILPTAIAALIGLTPSGPNASFRTAGGGTFRLPTLPQVDLSIEGYRITDAVAFSSSPAFSPIVGRLQLIAAFDVGFDVGSWYWG